MTLAVATTSRQGSSKPKAASTSNTTEKIFCIAGRQTAQVLAGLYSWMICPCSLGKASP